MKALSKCRVCRTLCIIVGITLTIFTIHFAFSEEKGVSLKTEKTKKHSPLKGKKICLDPGHGGSQMGAVGAKGLAEKDVNLKEALMLKKMLEKAGATVVMTRSDDSAISITDRWKFNRAQKTDLFVSMHHNANAQGDTSVNRIEVFYHWKDRGGPSEDAARLLYRELQALLKLPDSKTYMCWAYGVLRENSYPAILAEPSYLQNPEEEIRLRDEKYLRSICEAYFHAIEKFFAGGRPEIVTDKEINVSSDGIIRARIIQPEGTALTDPQRIRAELDGKTISQVDFNPETGVVEIALPEKTSNDEHELVLAARNLAGHTSKVFREKFDMKDVSPVKPDRDTKELFQGALKGKVIVLDPEGGGNDPVAIGEKGLRASDANLITALYLYDYLERAGVDVSITRKIDKTMDNVSRVRFGLERKPDIFMTIGHRLPEPGMGEKPRMYVSRIGSRWDGGQKIGRHLIFHLRQLLGTGKEPGNISSREPFKGEVHGWSSWEVMHAAQKYTATYVCPIMFDAPGVEDRISTTAGCRKEALAILYGTLDYFGLDDRKMASIEGKVVDKKSGEVLRDALIFLDDTLVTQTESDGQFLFKFLEQGKHKILVMCQDYKTLKREINVITGEPQQIKIEMASLGK